MAHIEKTTKPNPASLLKALKRTVLFLVVLLTILLLPLFNFLHVGYFWNLVAVAIGAFLYPILKSEISMPVVNALFPLAAGAIAQERQFRENLAKATHLVIALQSFGLWEFKPDLAEKLAEQVPPVRPDVEVYCLEQIVKQEGYRPTETFNEVFRFLYEASTNAVPSQLWNSRKKSIAGELSDILLRSTRSKKGPADFVPAKDDLVRLILQIESMFSLDVVNELICKLGSIWSHTRNYVQFLSEQGVLSTTATITTGELLDLVEGRDVSLAVSNDEPEILFYIWKQWFRKNASQLDITLVDTLCLISIVVFVRYREPNQSEWRRKACREASAQDRAAQIVLAYLEFEKQSKEMGNASVGTLKYLIENWEEKVRELEEALKSRKHEGGGFIEEIARIQNNLFNEDWPLGLPDHLFQTFTYLGKRSRLRAVIDEQQWLQTALRGLFRDLTPETIKRFLQARTVSPYFITFSPGDLRPVAPLLEQLEAKYNFKQYTDSVRIGVVPKRFANFAEFWNAFRRDFTALVTAQDNEKPHGQKGNIELILHQFDISSKNYYGFDLENVSKETALQRLQDLFQGTLTSQELVELFEYQADIPITKLLLGARISDLIADLPSLSLPSLERDVIREHGSELQHRIEERISIPNIRGNASASNLAQYFLKLNQAQAGETFLKQDKRRREKDNLIRTVSSAVKTVLGSHIPSLDRHQCRQIAETYLLTIASVAAIDSSPPHAIGNQEKASC